MRTPLSILPSYNLTDSDTYTLCNKAERNLEHTILKSPHLQPHRDRYNKQSLEYLWKHPVDDCKFLQDGRVLRKHTITELWWVGRGRLILRSQGGSPCCRWSSPRRPTGDILLLVLILLLLLLLILLKRRAGDPLVHWTGVGVLTYGEEPAIHLLTRRGFMSSLWKGARDPLVHWTRVRVLTCGEESAIH